MRKPLGSASVSYKCGALVVAAAGFVAVSAQAQVLGPLQRITTTSIFNDCTADQPQNQPGTLYPNTEIEPNLAINPANPQKNALLSRV